MLTTLPPPPATESAIRVTPTAISVKGLAKSFKGAPVLTGIDLDVAAGELVALLGPSGSGKTTLLRIIAGLETPDAGIITFGGENTTGVPVQQRGVGFVFQHYALFKHMTVADNIAYGLNARPRRTRPPKEVIAERVGALLDLIRLSNFADRYPSQLSGGQRQRVALARALAVEPRVLLLDEPFGALDAQVRKDLRRWLREIHQRTGQTTLFVTHDQDEALELADRVAILQGGRLEQFASPAQVQDNPASVAVLRFLGDAIELPAEIIAGTCYVRRKAVAVDPADFPAGPARLFVRPWQLEVARTEDAHLAGRVRSAYRAQGRAHLTIEDPDGALMALSISDSAMPRVDEHIGLRIVGGHLFV